MSDINDKILLESGTNELEFLEFIVGNQSFGINIAKVSEIMMYIEPISLPNSSEFIEGIISPRQQVIPVVDLHSILKRPKKEGKENVLIVCSFNQLNVAFHVSGVRGIKRVSWADVKKPPQITVDDNEIITGLTMIKEDGKERISLILDFEKIVSDLNQSSALDIDSVSKVDNPDVYKKYNIVVAEDSMLLNKLVVESLRKAGYTNIQSFQNGQEAWAYISNKKSADDIQKEVSCLISDIEMPQMDGHHLTKLIKSDDKLKKIPVILFSSLINDQMRAKGKIVGADAQYSKPEIKALIDGLKNFLN